MFNDAYAPILGAKQPEALGRRFQAIWTEIWSDIVRLIDKATAGEAVRLEDLPLRMNRRDFDEDTAFSSPTRQHGMTLAG